MSTFADDLIVRCFREAVRTQGTEAHADLSLDVASALALTLAVQARGNPVAAEVILRCLMNELPEMVRRRCEVVREDLLEGRLQ